MSRLRFPRRLLMLLLALCLSVPLPVAAERGLQWTNRGDEEGAVLAYEVPNTSDQLLYLGCDKKTGALKLSAQFDVKGLAPNRPVTLSFAVPGAKVNLEARTETDELFPYSYPTADGFQGKDLLDLLSMPGEITVSAHKGRTKLAAAGRARAVASFRAACRLG